ncbi:acyl carrier protein [Nonomuraea sp. NPDC049421]|uniref:Acyl carrier protein n=1 Tax=Nonomuraea salmonea TaxID=46181 RepID=A0ABV5NE19_9ACTN
MSEQVSRVVTEVLAEILGEDAGRLRHEDVLAERDWDSISSLEALAQLESRLRVTLDLREFHAVRTVGDLTELVGRTTAA